VCGVGVVLFEGCLFLLLGESIAPLFKGTINSSERSVLDCRTFCIVLGKLVLIEAKKGRSFCSLDFQSAFRRATA
jgi:hypothetical protein